MANKKKILITAGGGFIAKNLNEKLRLNCDVTSLCHSELDLLDAEKVAALIKSGKFDVVIHTATHDPAPKYSTKDPAKVLENNLKMFFNVARCSGDFGKMIFFGSGAEFDRTRWIPKMKETYFDKFVPSDQYGFSKYIMTKHALESENIYNLRIFSVFGKYEDWRYRLISKACCYAALDRPVVIDRNTFYDYVYVDDLARIVEYFIERTPKNMVYNACSGSVAGAAEIAQKVIRASGKNLDIVARTNEERREYSGDNSLLMSEMRDFNFSTLDDSIASLYRWYAANKSMIDENEL